MKLSWSRFEKLVGECYERVLEAAPPDIRAHIERSNLQIVALERPDAASLAAHEIDDPDELLGQYIAGASDELPMPDRVCVYRLGIESVSEDVDQAEEEIVLTLIHELAHHFGFEEDAMDEWEAEIYGDSETDDENDGGGGA
jgi:predicted Zn-dependent protease with MMP-like domain